MKINEIKYQDIKNNLDNLGKPIGLEFHPFCIGWYNEHVSSKFHLEYSEDTLAFCAISTPKFFDECFLPYVKTIDYKTIQDPFDKCLIATFQALLKQLTNDGVIDIIHDFELHATRRPKILVQTAGHVSGAAYYYQKRDVISHSWSSKNVYGVSCHPIYGGWFGFRGTIVFKDLQFPSLKKQDPVDSLNNDQKIQYLEGFNFHWKDWSFRDVCNPSGERYSEFQKLYFRTKPADRFELLNNYFNLSL